MPSDENAETDPQRAALRRLLSLQEPDESDAAFARRIGIAPQVLSNYKNGHHSLSLKSALTVHDSCGVSLDWLLAGHGSPYMSGEDGEHPPFEAGSRYVFDRLARSVAEIAEDLEQSGGLTEEEAREIRASLGRYLGEAGEERGGR